MGNSLSLQLYNQITEKMLNPEWLAPNAVSDRIIRKHVESINFMKQINTMVKNKDYSCQAVLVLCESLLNDLAGSRSRDAWLDSIYQFALRKSFPNAVDASFSPHLTNACQLYLEALRVVSEFQKTVDDGTWLSRYPMDFLSEEEKTGLENPTEYRRFLKGFREDYVYEMMKINQEVMGFTSLDHICGVHYLALFLARQLAQAGVPIDLGRISGAAAGHDIGKFCCKRCEASRVPYLHYYYTGQWFKKHNITYIRHIAIYHSTWDLELENLSLESLILIYCDFRVKNREKKMTVYDLNESFDVILKKLDNVDAAKEKRYRRVYAKLKDFEDYLKHIGISVDMEIPLPERGDALPQKVNYSLLQGREVIENIKYLVISHNINVMYQLRDEFSLNTLLELARSETDWHNLRTYLRVFEEYSTYLTPKQKLNTLKFLYDQLIHPEDDIRKQSAELIGMLISFFDEEYRKEIPEGVTMERQELSSVELLDRYLHLFIYPDHKIIPTHRTWIGYSLVTMISSLINHCRPNYLKPYRSVLLKYYQIDTERPNEMELYLIDAAKYIPVGDNDPDLNNLFLYILHMLKSPDQVLRLGALETISSLLPLLGREFDYAEELKDLFRGSPFHSSLPCENFLRLRLAKQLDLAPGILEHCRESCRLDARKIPEMFLSNLKTATEWKIKKIQVEMLLEHVLDNQDIDALYTAMHFCNLLKVSVVEEVRKVAGEALVQLIPSLSFEQRNDVVVELMRALEIRGYQFSEIPYYLGQLIISLQPVELDEIIGDFRELIKQSNPKLIYLLLRTIGFTIVNYPKYQEIFREDEKTVQERLIKMLGVLLSGLGNYHLPIKQVAFSVIGREIFGSSDLSLEQKKHIFTLIAKKVLTLLTDNKKEALLLLTNSASLNHIYRFISDYVFFHDDIHLKMPEKVAFFPGAFDPYSLGHKEITRTIRDLGFEVYLQVDEFSWSKQTLPHNLRRNIINMSIADELNIYLYPEDFPTNIVNSHDLASLRGNFPHSQVYMVVGSDVILNASAYQAQGENSIYHFPHIIFERKNVIMPDDNDQGLDEAVKKIQGEVIKLALPPQYEDISSTQIRNYIDENRDISSLVDPLAQQYIYENGFYRREPQYKTLIKTISLKVEVVEKCTGKLEKELSLLFYGKNHHTVLKRLHDFLQKPSARMIMIRDVNKNGKVVGFSLFHGVRSSDLFYEFQSGVITQFLRENAVGRIVLIDGIFIDQTTTLENLEQTILNETLIYCLGQDYHYGVFRNNIEDRPSASVYDILRLHGFQELSQENPDRPVFIVNMNDPCTLTLNVEAMIKEPLRNNLNVKKAIIRTRKRLQEAMTRLYPGNLVLTFDFNLIHESLVQKICEENGVSTVPTVPRKLGPAMCVPFGNIFNRYMVPNTVTKALHTERLFAPDMQSFTIRHFPHYLDLEYQIKMLRSFNRPVILVDDLLHKGYRIQALDPLLKQEGIEVQKIFVGLLSGRGKELMDIQNRKVDGAYFVPKLRAWFNEDMLYPFIGGDTLWRGVYPQRNLLPSINLIMPYTSPTFILKDASLYSIYELSQTCIENSQEILRTIEHEYLTIHGRTLTLALMGEAFIAPRSTEHGKNMNFDLNLGPSHYLQNDLELLNRMKHLIK